MKESITKSGLRWIILSLLILAAAPQKLFGQSYDIGILYTANTNGYIYPCDCSNEILGGLAQRSTVFAKARQSMARSPLILDAGNFHASYPKDVDHARLVAKLAGLLKYDARNIGDQELVYGRQFFQDYIQTPGLLSANLDISRENKLIKPYILKKKSGFRIAILGLLTKNAYSVVPDSIQGLFELRDELKALKQTLAIVKQHKPDLVILLLRALDYNLEFKLAREFQSLDVIITCSERFALKPVWHENRTWIASPGKGGEQVGQLLLKHSNANNTWQMVQAKHIRLNNQIIPDKKILNRIQNHTSR